MEVRYTSEVQQSSQAKLVEQASSLLADILGPQSAKGVTGDWTALPNQRGKTLYRLTIQDSTGEVSTDFAPDELQNRLHMQFRLARLWGDLLQVRNDRQHQQVQLLSEAITTGS